MMSLCDITIALIGRRPCCTSSTASAHDCILSQGLRVKSQKTLVADAPSISRR